MPNWAAWWTLCMPEMLQAYSTVLFLVCHVGFHAGKHGSVAPKHGIGGSGGGGGGASGGSGASGGASPL